MRMPCSWLFKPALLSLLLSSIYRSITTTINNSNMHLIKITPFVTTIKHGKKNLRHLANAMQPWVSSKKELARNAANSAMMEFHEKPPWNRFPFPEPESDDDGKSWYKGDEQKFMSRGRLPSDIDIDDDQESWYEGDEEFFDAKDMSLKIGFTELDKLYQNSFVSIKPI